MTIITPFQGPDFSVRVVQIDNEPWFVGKDVAAQLGYANETDAMNRHCKGVVKRYPLPTAGGVQEMRIISEPDVLRLIVNSNLPAAERFERWVFEEVLPAIRKSGGYALPQVEQVKAVVDATKLFPPMFRIARMIGCDKNAAAISANQAVHAVSGTNVLALLGRTHLEAENQDAVFVNPTQLGKALGGISAQKVNLLLAGAGLQAKVGEHWTLLDAGKDFARIEDTGKRQNSGTPVQQIKWSATVLPLLRAEEVA